MGFYILSAELSKNNKVCRTDIITYVVCDKKEAIDKANKDKVCFINRFPELKPKNFTLYNANINSKEHFVVI